MAVSAGGLAREGPPCEFMRAPEPARRSMPESDVLECQILAVARTADRRAFVALFEHFAPRVKGYLMRSGSNAELAEELAQETMLIVWRKAPSFDPARARLSTWIFTIARNLRIDRHRRGGGVEESVAPEWDADQQPADANASPDELVVAAQRARGVRDAVAELPAEHALVLRLSFFDEHPHARIAEELGIPLGTVKSRIRRAVAQLRHNLIKFDS